MLTVTGTAEFVFDNGQTYLRFRAAIQPHLPQESNVLKQVSVIHGLTLEMDHGQLTIAANLGVPK